MRSHDRRGIAEDIFDVAGVDDVSAAHIEEVSRRYRERLAGAQKILLARQIGDEILRWQREPQKSLAPRTADSRREDDEIIGIELDSMSLSVADVARAVAAKNAAEAAARSEHPPAAREAGRSEPPASSSLGPRGATPSKIASPSQWSAPPARGASSSPQAPASTPPPSSSSPDRARSEGAVDWAVAPRAPNSTVPKADVDEPGLWAPLRSQSNPAPRDRDVPDQPPLGLPPPGPAPLSAPPLGPPPARDGTISVPPLAGPTPSSPPGFGGDLPHSPAPPRTPSRRPRAPDTAATTFEIDGDSIRATPSSASGAPPSSRSPASAAPWPGSPSSFAVPRTQASGGGLTRKHGIIAGVALAAVVAVVIVLRTSAALSSRPTEVTGHTVSDHLGLKMQFAEPWTHERKRDDDGSKLGFRRATSTYFQGVTPDDFLMQLTIVSLTPEDHPASLEDVRKIGSTELVQDAVERVCAPLERDDGAIRCIAKATHKARSFALLEEYFLAGSRVVYARAMVEALGAATPAGPPKNGEIVEPPPATPPPLIATVDEAKVQAILDSIETL